MRIAALSLALLGCAGSPEEPPLKVRAVGEGQTCTVTVNGSVMHDDAQLAALDRPPGRGVVLDAGRDTPYRCLGGTIVRLQRAGFRVLAVTADGVPLPSR